jgi:CRISPR/Cas system CSM-associated protein Csm2 small subunit
VDLQRLRPQLEDKYPEETREEIKDNTFKKMFEKVLDKNFNDEDQSERLFNTLLAVD